MGRKKINKEDKKINFGITLDPETIKILDKLSQENNISVSSIIEKSLKEYFDKKENNNE